MRSCRNRQCPLESRPRSNPFAQTVCFLRLEQRIKEMLATNLMATFLSHKWLRKGGAGRTGQFPGIGVNRQATIAPMVHVPSYRQRPRAAASIQTLACGNCLRATCIPVAHLCASELASWRDDSAATLTLSKLRIRGLILFGCVGANLPDAVDVPDTFVNEVIRRQAQPTVVPSAMLAGARGHPSPTPSMPLER